MNEKKAGIPGRSEIAAEYKWRINDMFCDDDAWEIERLNLSEYAKGLSAFRGRLTECSSSLLECLTMRDDVFSRAETLYAYAKMRRDEDNTKDKYQALSDIAMSLYSEITSISSYVAPELIAAGRSRVEELLNENSELSSYTHYLDELFRRYNHILSEGEETILALAGEPLLAADEIYSMLTNADLKFPDILDENSKLVELSEGRYALFLENPDRDVRERAFCALYGTYEKFRNTIGASLSASIKKERFISTVRKYGSDIEMNLDEDNIPVSLYDSLIDTVDKHLGLLHRYLRLRKRALNLPELRMFDLYTPVIMNTERRITYKEAIKLVKNGVAPLGEQYLSDLSQAFEKGWIDVYENRHKTRGAYSYGTFLSHPYILLNYQERVDDVLTLAHELGHSMHSYYTNKRQPYIYSGYRIFVAEVASTVNESLVLEHMTENAADNREKAYLLNRQLESIRGTLFRQTMFAEFERTTHKMAEKGHALTPDTFCGVYKELNVKYYAAEMTVDSEIALEWARIPHFYRAFYVYQYATGISAALSLSRDIRTECIGGDVALGTESALNKYLHFLSSGDSLYPLELLKHAGVDLSTSAPVENAMKCFEKALIELEGLI